MTSIGVIDKTKDLSVDTGNRLFSYISLVERLNTQKKRVCSVKVKNRN